MRSIANIGVIGPDSNSLKLPPVLIGYVNDDLQHCNRDGGKSVASIPRLWTYFCPALCVIMQVRVICEYVLTQIHEGPGGDCSRLRTSYLWPSARLRGRIYLVYVGRSA